MKNITSITIESDIEVIGMNPENADMGNPTGEIYGECYFICATTEDGEVFSHFKVYSHLEEENAIAFGEKVQKAISAGRPLDSNFWRYRRPVYGSEAWIKEDNIRQIACSGGPEGYEEYERQANIG
jgi:hypothetical protein